METKKLRKQVNNELKLAGIKRNDYSLKIKESRYADVYIDCEIKNPHLNIAKINNVLNKYNKIDIDYANLEILNGCNTFVNVRYSYNCFDEVSKEFDNLASEKLEEARKIKDNCGLKAFENSRWRCWLFNVDGQIIVKVNNLAQKIIDNTKELSILMFRMNEFEEDFL